MGTLGSGWRYSHGRPRRVGGGREDREQHGLKQRVGDVGSGPTPVRTTLLKRKNCLPKTWCLYSNDEASFWELFVVGLTLCVGRERPLRPLAALNGGDRGASPSKAPLPSPYSGLVAWIALVKSRNRLIIISEPW